MARVMLSGLLGGLAMWLVGFIFWGTPLSALALHGVADADAGAVQAALAQHLGAGGTGTYWLPSPGTAAGTEMVGRGPNALVHFVNSGLAVPDGGSLIGGLVLGIVCALLLAFAMRAMPTHATPAARMKLVAMLAVAFTAYSDLGQPIFNQLGWGYFVYLWISEVASWMAAGAVIAWLLPRPTLPPAA